jgi:hypothetical protein
VWKGYCSPHIHWYPGVTNQLFTDYVKLTSSNIKSCVLLLREYNYWSSITQGAINYTNYIKYLICFKIPHVQLLPLCIFIMTLQNSSKRWAWLNCFPLRWNRRKLQLFYNVVNKNTPNYLCTLIPPTIQRTSVYPLRNGNDIILSFCRLSSTSDSFIPSTIKIIIPNLSLYIKFEFW